MRVLAIIGLILTISCTKQNNVLSDDPTTGASSTADIKFNAVDFDSLTLKQLIIRNDELLNILNIELSDKVKAERINAMMQSDSNRLRIYRSCEFKIKEDKRCNGYRHLLITKERNEKGFDLAPYKGLYLMIIDSTDKVIFTEKLEEKSLTLDMTSTIGETNWSLEQDSLVTIKSKSTFCSDIIIEGQGTTCWTDEVQKQYKLRCNGLELVKKDSVRTESKE